MTDDRETATGKCVPGHVGNLVTNHSVACSAPDAPSEQISGNDLLV
jgi:hypothetical protein